jgi:hypothetical protein
MLSGAVYVVPYKGNGKMMEIMEILPNILLKWDTTNLL